MKSKTLILMSLVCLLLGGCNTKKGNNPIDPDDPVDPVDPVDPPDYEGNEYDNWVNTWSKPGHLYFHYNRGADATDYDNYCLWLWPFFPNNLEGTLWGYSGPTQVSSKLTLKPMSTAFMTYQDVGLEGNNTYKDDYGIIFDVDLTRTDLVGGKTGTSVSFADAEELGFLLPLQNSMDGKKNWTSDGGSETYIDDYSESKNWRDVDGGQAIHIFVSTGDLSNYAYYAGDGAPTPKTNPIDVDTTGNYRSQTETIATCTAEIPTSSTFKELGVGYQIFVASFRDSNGDGIGDIRGVIDSLDYLEDLGIECLWLTPVQKSDSYHGYDINDYLDIDRRYGSKDDYAELISKAHEKGMKVLMDLVLNHTSKTNSWFTKSKWGVNSGIAGTSTDDTGINWRNVYTWKYATDTIQKAKVVKSGSTYTATYETITVQEDAESDNPSWYRDGESNYYYYGKFGSGMPEINYENNATRKLIIDTAKEWLAFGVDGFRLDAVKHIYMKDEVDSTGNDVIITDVGEKTAYDDEKGQYITKKYDYSSDLTKNVNWWREFSSSLKADYPNCFLVGENFDGWGTRISPYYQALDSQFDFSNYYHVPAWIYNADGGAANYDNGQAAETYDTFASSSTYNVGSTSSPIYVTGGGRSDYINGAFTSNHDVMRLINQANGTGNKNGTTALEKVEYGDATIDCKAKFQAAVTLLNPGLSWIYYGDELGMSSNTDQHIDKYGSENSMDIWYRQPFLWNDKASRPNYKSGQYTFELDSHNKKLLNNGEGIKYNAETGEVSTSSTFYPYYQGLCTLKKMYPDNAKVKFDESSDNVLRIVVTGDGSKTLVIYINNGLNNNEYKINLTSDYHNVMSLNNATTSLKGNIGATSYGVTAFMKE